MQKTNTRAGKAAAAKTRAEAAPKEEPKVETTDSIEQEMQGRVTKSGDTVIVCMNRAIGIRYTLKDGTDIIIPGNSAQLRYKDTGKLNTGGGFSLTEVPRAAWEEIEARYKDTALFKSGRIFAQTSRASALAEAKEKRDTRHGLEPTTGVSTKPASEKKE